jgi:hypothetical protein
VSPRNITKHAALKREKEKERKKSSVGRNPILSLQSIEKPHYSLREVPPAIFSGSLYSH